jgi:large conductance mechanosensitive channel
MSFSSEFKEFAIKGNVMDLAIGVIIGAAFGKIVDSLVKDIIMPIAGLITGPQGFVNSYFPLSSEVRAARLADPTLSLEAAREKGNVLAWGSFLTVCIDFLIIALIVFMLVKAVNRLRKDQPPAAA